MGLLGSLLWPVRPLLLRLRPYLGPNFRRIPGVLQLKPLLRPFVLRVRAFLEPPRRPVRVPTYLPTPHAADLLACPSYPPRRDRPRVLHAIGSLGPGGAERQLCNLMVASARRGYDAQLLHFGDLMDEGGHYRPLLANAGIPLHGLGSGDPPTAPDAELARLATEPLPHLTDAVRVLRRVRPDVMHCWLDYTNIIAGVAAACAGVPAILLSTRSLNPTNFPGLLQPWFRPWYELLVRHPRVHLINNSAIGAADYARWLDVPAGRFHVIRNGIDPAGIAAPTPAALAAFRAKLGIPPAALVIAGVFRLGEEKQPEVFFEVVRRALRVMPAAHAVVAGSGPLEGAARAAVARMGLERRVHFLGRCQAVPTVLAAADVVLLTSRVEGTPNVLLEAQWLGRPVVSTRAGGAVETLRDGETGLLADVGDGDGLTRCVLALLTDRQRRQAYGHAATAFVRERFGLERMVRATCALYDHALSGQAGGGGGDALDEIPAAGGQR